MTTMMMMMMVVVVVVVVVHGGGGGGDGGGGGGGSGGGDGDGGGGGCGGGGIISEELGFNEISKQLEYRRNDIIRFWEQSEFYPGSGSETTWIFPDLWTAGGISQDFQSGLSKYS